MDQQANLREQNELATAILKAADRPDYDIRELQDMASRLAELVVALAEWNTPANRNARELQALATVTAAHRRVFGGER